VKVSQNSLVSYTKSAVHALHDQPVLSCHVAKAAGLNADSDNDNDGCIWYWAKSGLAHLELMQGPTSIPNRQAHNSNGMAERKPRCADLVADMAHGKTNPWDIMRNL
jgi:hypothetical protein